MAQQGLFEKLCMLKLIFTDSALLKNIGITGVWIIIENTVVIMQPMEWDRRVKHYIHRGDK
jgi:hypothetical protein